MMLPPETKLMLDCLRNDPPDVKIRNLQALKDEDWHVVLKEAKRYQMAPLLYHAFKASLTDLSIPPDVMGQLKEAYYIAASRNMVLYRQLKDILVEFNKNNILVILLKGAHLAQFVYGNIALRSMCDIDLLVKKEDIGKAYRIFIRQGYKIADQNGGNSEAHLPPFKGKDKVTVEIHFNIHSPPITERYSVEDLWLRSQAMSLQSVKVRTLCPEDLLIHICIHASILHGFNNGIKPLVDIWRIVECYKNTMDWQRLLLIGHQMKVTNCLFLMLALTNKMLGFKDSEQIPSECMSVNDDMITCSEELIFGNVSSVTSNIAKLFSNENWREKTKLLLQRTFPPKETIVPDETITKTSFLFYITYLTRLKYLIKQYGKIILGVLIKDREALTSIDNEKRKNAFKRWLAS